MNIGSLVSFFVKKNNFWENGELVEKALVESNIKYLQTFFGDAKLDSVYIFGSIAKLKDRKYYHLAPNDIDIYLRFQELVLERDLVKKIKAESENLTWPGNLPPHIHIDDQHPIKNHEIDISVVYRI